MGTFFWMEAHFRTVMVSTHVQTSAFVAWQSRLTARWQAAMPKSSMPAALKQKAPFHPNVLHSGELLRNACYRCTRLLERSETPVLKASLIRKTRHWLPLGRLGPDTRHLGLNENTRRITSAVTIACADQTQLPMVEQLAAAPGMGRSEFHLHFRSNIPLSSLSARSASA